MATVLEQYNDLKGRIGAKIASGQLHPDHIREFPVQSDAAVSGDAVSH